VTLAVLHIGDSHSGDLAGTPIAGDALLCADGAITWIGATADVDLTGAYQA
jgi:enamidase